MLWGFVEAVKDIWVVLLSGLSIRLGRSEWWPWAFLKPLIRAMVGDSSGFRKLCRTHVHVQTVSVDPRHTVKPLVPK
jgi:hypothetical protein